MEPHLAVLGLNMGSQQKRVMSPMLLSVGLLASVCDVNMFLQCCVSCLCCSCLDTCQWPRCAVPLRPGRRRLFLWRSCPRNPKTECPFGDLSIFKRPFHSVFLGGLIRSAAPFRFRRVRASVLFGLVYRKAKRKPTNFFGGIPQTKTTHTRMAGPAPAPLAGRLGWPCAGGLS